MNTITATEAQAKIFSLMDEVTEEREPVKITGENSNVVLISEADWNSIQETLHIISIPGLRESIIGGLNTPLEDCETELEWQCGKSFFQTSAKGRGENRSRRIKEKS